MRSDTPRDPKAPGRRYLEEVIGNVLAVVRHGCLPLESFDLPGVTSGRVGRIPGPRYVMETAPGRVPTPSPSKGVGDSEGDDGVPFTGGSVSSRLPVRDAPFPGGDRVAWPDRGTRQRPPDRPGSATLPPLSGTPALAGGGWMPHGPSGRRGYRPVPGGVPTRARRQGIDTVYSVARTTACLGHPI